MKPFRIHHLLELMKAYEQGRLPLDVQMANYFRSNKAIGSKDKAFIAERAYGLLRWRGLLDYLTKEPSWEARLKYYETADLEVLFRDTSIPSAVRCCVSQDLYKELLEAYGEARTEELCRISQQRAPTTLRVNLLKTTREALLERWKEPYFARPTLRSPWGIQLEKSINFLGMDEFKQGLFEVQDEASQLAAGLVQVKPGELALDFCAGSGGKSLAIAPPMQNKGQLYLHDVRVKALQEAKLRLKRAGIQNAQIVTPESALLKKLKKKMDWVLVDAPCSGTGTLRRNPDMKWAFTSERLQELKGLQRLVFEQALSCVKPGGKIVYATCSILPAENEEQVAHFLKTHPLKKVGDSFLSFPTEGGMDGFFAAVLERTC